MTNVPLYPLKFEPTFQYRVWGGRRLADFMSQTLPEGPVGEAWILSDRDDHSSVVSNGELKGLTLGQLLMMWPEALLGDGAAKYARFPLILKFLDAREKLSVQVHPSDAQTRYLPRGEHGKTEAWVVLEAEPKSVVYAGLQTNTTSEQLRSAIANGIVEQFLPTFTPQVGDGVFIPAGTVHALGEELLIFEVQENSDVTFRLFDWGRIDPKTGKLRTLQIDEALACTNFPQAPITPVVPVGDTEDPGLREQLFECPHFGLWRLSGIEPFSVGIEGKARVIVCVSGEGNLKYGDDDCPIQRGDVVVLPASVGSCFLMPTVPITVFEISLPDGAFR